MVEQINKSSKKRRNIVIATGAFLVLLGLFLIFGFNIAGSTRPIKEVADKFNPGSNWKFESESVRPPRFFCLDGGSCPQLYRSWISSRFSVNDFENSIKATGWAYEFRSNCESSGINLKKNSFLCWADAHDDKYKMDISIENKDDNQIELTLYIMPK